MVPLNLSTRVRFVNSELRHGPLHLGILTGNSHVLPVLQRGQVNAALRRLGMGRRIVYSRARPRDAEQRHGLDSPTPPDIDRDHDLPIPTLSDHSLANSV